MIKQKIWDCILKRAKERDVSLNKLAKEVKVCRASIDNIRIQKNYNIDTLIAICEYLELDLFKF